MATIRKISVIEQAEQSIREMIMTGKVGDELPGIRALCAQLGVSAPTVTAAMRRLRQAGLVAKRTPNSRHRVIGKPGNLPLPKPAARPRKLLFIMHEEWPEMNTFERALVTQAVRALGGDGFEVDAATLPFAGAQSAQKRWRWVIDQHNPSHLAISKGNQAVVDWARATGLPFVLLGARSRVRDALVIGTPFSAMLADALHRLVELGHRRVVVPVFNHSRDIASVIEGSVGTALGLAPGEVARLGLVPYVDSNDARDREAAFVRAVEQSKATAALLLEWRDLLLAWSSLARRGVRVPEDFSLATACNEPELRWLRPHPAHYNTHPELYIKLVRRWVHGRPIHDDSVTKALLRSWTPGESLAPPAR